MNIYIYKIYIHAFQNLFHLASIGPGKYTYDARTYVLVKKHALQ